MISTNIRPGSQIVLTASIIWVVLAATAIPIELRPLGRAPLNWNIGIPDFVENVLGFVPVGIAFAELGLLPAILLAALMSVVAEASQLWMLHRTSQFADVAANVTGGFLGAFVGARYRIRLPALPINKKTGLVTATIAFLLAVWISITSGDPVNTRGATTPGALEAEWRFDETDHRSVLDSSGHHLNGALHGQPVRVSGVMGGAIRFDGARDYIDFGHSTPLRLTGSMTITAWIRSTSFPFDDAVIVSQRNPNVGYQLDTTIDRGRRTIGFKLHNACGELMARYGATPLITGTWYHVAGVYDAKAKTMDVYLNGRLDNGFLLGTITSSQISSRSTVYVGRRAAKTFEFAEDIDDVRIYSTPLTKSEIAAVMQGNTLDSLPATREHARPSSEDGECVILSYAEDARIPGAVAALGVLVTIACVCLWPTAGRLIGLIISLVAGFFVFGTRAPFLPSFNLWMMPLVSFMGSLSVAFSIKFSGQNTLLESSRLPKSK